jgi:hypothetical protein
MSNIPQPPQLYKCNKCQVYFYTYSQLLKPTHVRCHGHNTRQATQEEIEWIQKVNGGK